jgi:hypothetical protein
MAASALPREIDHAGACSTGKAHIGHVTAWAVHDTTWRYQGSSRLDMLQLLLQRPTVLTAIELAANMQHGNLDISRRMAQAERFEISCPVS